MGLGLGTTGVGALLTKACSTCVAGIAVFDAGSWPSFNASATLVEEGENFGKYTFSLVLSSVFVGVRVFALTFLRPCICRDVLLAPKEKLESRAIAGSSEKAFAGADPDGTPNSKPLVVDAVLCALNVSGREPEGASVLLLVVT